MMFNEPKPYYNTMDREGYVSHEESAGFTDSNYATLPAVGHESPVVGDQAYGVRNVGMSAPIDIIGGIPGLQGKIRMGASNLEIGFTGVQHSQQKSQTPGVYGHLERQAIREIAQAQEVQLTTHAAYNLYGMAGQDQHGNFSREHRKMAVDEVKQAIDFARDTAKGGSVVVHTGEFQRPIYEAPWSRDSKGRQIFKAYHDEEAHAVIRVVDQRSGKVMEEVRRDTRIPIAQWKKADKDYEGEYQYKSNDPMAVKKTHIKKGDYIDYWGRKIIDPLDPEFGRIPEYDEQSRRFVVRYQQFDDFKKDAEEWNKLENERRRRLGEKPLDDYERVTPEEQFLRATLETQEGYSRGWALRFSQDVNRAKEDLEKVRKSYNYWVEVEKNTPEDQKWRLKQDFERSSSGLIPSEYKLPSEWLKKLVTDNEKQLIYNEQTAVNQERQAKQYRETINNIKSASKFAERQWRTSYADLGIHAWQETKRNHLPKPLMLTMENIFPEKYGGHFDELKHVVQGSREEMAKRLQVHHGMSPEEAKKAAEEHIKVTFDTGHLNTFRKYFVAQPGEKSEDTDTRFKKWYLEQVENLAKAKMIGNVHFVDNWGYNDDHLAPGQGTVPTKELLTILKKHGYKGPLTMEPGADATVSGSDFVGLLKTWQHLGSPVYSMNMSMFGGGMGLPSRSWTDIQYSYFGQPRSPYFIFGTYSPSNDWQLWSQVPLE